MCRLIPARAGKTCSGWCRRRRSAAHPRACGENPGDRTESATLDGSSPRVRGKRGLQRRLRGFAGLIPARAGKTTCSTRGSPPTTAHPRACGENEVSVRRCASGEGSSPRVRGKPELLADSRVETRLIPARAGKTIIIFGTPENIAAHPRACGENRPRPCRMFSCEGSSPRVRGKREVIDAHSARVGLIPARAGKTTRGIGPSVNPGAHPRACGENMPGGERVELGTGSSPRVRGKRTGTTPTPPPGRLIPARAGKTDFTGGGHWGSPAHPRACGENSSVHAAGPPIRGSSPRVRGKRSQVCHLHQFCRLIPARAGKTRGHPVHRLKEAAHPRACGENIWDVLKPIRDAGSSPRVRGKLRAVRAIVRE